MMHVSVPREPPKFKEGKADIACGEELRVEKKLRAMLEKKVSALQKRIDTESVELALCQERAKELEAELFQAQETISAFGDVRETLIIMQQQSEERRIQKGLAEKEISSLRRENEELKRLVETKDAENGELKRVVETKDAEYAASIDKWKESVDNLALREHMSEEDKKSLSEELERTKVEHSTLLEHARKLLGQYEHESEEKLNLQERVMGFENGRAEECVALKEAKAEETRARERAEEENSRLRGKNKILEENEVGYRAKLQALMTHISALQKKSDGVCGSSIAGSEKNSPSMIQKDTTSVRGRRTLRVNNENAAPAAQSSSMKELGNNSGEEKQIKPTARRSVSKPAMLSRFNSTPASSTNSRRHLPSTGERIVGQQRRVDIPATKKWGANNNTRNRCDNDDGDNVNTANKTHFSLPLFDDGDNNHGLTTNNKSGRHPLPLFDCGKENDNFGNHTPGKARSVRLPPKRKPAALTLEEKLDRDMRAAMDDFGTE